ncbi:MAG: methionyl-tRNA formyltransferase [Clostridia bacterium]|nr:methionyl-tRNA formyltransferase [Clostridia bacterium]
MRVVFMGTPDFATTVLQRLISDYEVVAVISQPDRAKNRKGEFVYTPTKACAVANGIPVFQYERIRNHVEELRTFDADIFVTAAYGQILSQEIINIPRFGIVNVHASLLPKYRGSSPIQSAILNGDKVTGVTIMQTELGMDSGDILNAQQVEIGNMNTLELTAKLAEVGAELLIKTLELIESGKVLPKKQDESLVSGCKKLSKEAAQIDWSKSASEVCAVIRAFNPNPIAYTSLNGERIKIYEAVECAGEGEFGTVIKADKGGLVVACGVNAIKINQIQAPGKRVMTAAEFLNGNKLTIGEYFGK